MNTKMQEALVSEFNNKVGNDWYSRIKSARLKPVHSSQGDDLQLCINFIKIPGVMYSAVTVSVLYKGTPSKALTPVEYAKVMESVEGAVALSKPDESAPFLYSRLNHVLSNDWQRLLNSHRILFINSESTWGVISRLQEKWVLDTWRRNRIRVAQIHTQTYDSFSSIFMDLHDRSSRERNEFHTI